jgi:hypothetical protein
MSKSYEDMMLLYSKLDINDKRNEFSSLLEKTNELISEILKIEEIENDTKIKNYDANKNSNLTEDEIFTFFYEDLWNIKNRLLALLILNSSKDTK